MLNIWIKLIYYISQLDIYHQYSEVSELVHTVTATYRNTENPGPPCKAEQDCSGAPGTNGDLSQNWGFEVQYNHW